MKNFWDLKKHDYLNCIIENNLTEFTYKDIFNCITYNNKHYGDCEYWSGYIRENLYQLLKDGVLTSTFHSEKRISGSVTIAVFNNEYVKYKREKVLNKILK